MCLRWLRRVPGHSDRRVIAAEILTIEQINLPLFAGLQEQVCRRCSVWNDQRASETKVAVARIQIGLIVRRKHMHQGEDS